MANNDNFLVFIIGGLTGSQSSKLLGKVVSAKNLIAPNARGIGNVVKREAIGTCLQHGISQITRKK